MQASKTDENFADPNKASLGKRLAILFCIVASAVGWAAIVGLVLLLKPDLPF